MPRDQNGKEGGEMEVDTKLVQLLMEIGHIAGGHGYFDEARIIFEGIKAVRPESEYPLIGQAITQLNMGNYAEAARILGEEALGKNPENDLAASLLGLVLKISGLTSESERLLNHIVELDRDQTAVNMAKSILEEMKS
jgi:Flp pilus assembly protein TadD